jgi:hypothetical protein
MSERDEHATTIERAASTHLAAALAEQLAGRPSPRL